MYRLVGNEIDQILSDEDALDTYATEGRLAVNPVVSALASSSLRSAGQSDH